MNTIGKILVVLNLIFAVVVAGFLVIDYGTRTNWKTAYDALAREHVVSKANINVSTRTEQDINKRAQKAEAEKEELKQKLVDQEKIAQLKEESLQNMLKEEVERAKDADLNTQKAIAEKDRLKDEVKSLSIIVQTRDKAILELQNDNKKYRTEAIAQKNIAEAMQGRNVSLLEQVQNLERKIALRDAGVGNDNNDLRKDPNAPNPPSTYIKGKIDKVDPQDRSLVQISLGTDQGVNTNHTLEVFRLSPRPEYLGMIRIVNAKEHTAVGKLMRTGISGNRGPLQPGDFVASSLNNQAP